MINNLKIKFLQRRVKSSMSIFQQTIVAMENAVMGYKKLHDKLTTEMLVKDAHRTLIEQESADTEKAIENLKKLFK